MSIRMKMAMVVFFFFKNSKLFARSAVRELLPDGHLGATEALETFFQDELRLVDMPSAKDTDIGPAPYNEIPGGAGLDENGKLVLKSRYSGHVPGMDGIYLKKIDLPRKLNWDKFLTEVDSITGVKHSTFEAYTSGYLWSA